MTTPVRVEGPADAAAIRSVHEAAFAGPAEADLVDALRRDGDLVVGLVAEERGAVIGHVGFSRLDAGTIKLTATALAPVAVRPDRQRSGLGSALIRAGLERLRAMDEDVVLVLGDPDYYARFGFSVEAARAFRTPYDGPYLQALALSDRGRAAGGALTYAPAFAGLG